MKPPFTSRASLRSATVDVLDRATQMVNPGAREPRLARRLNDFDVWELVDSEGSTTVVDGDDVDSPRDVYAMLRPGKARQPTAKDVLAAICELEEFVVLTPPAVLARRTRRGWHARSREGHVAALHTHDVFEACAALKLLEMEDVRIDAHGRIISQASGWRLRFGLASPLPAVVRRALEVAR